MKQAWGFKYLLRTLVTGIVFAILVLLATSYLLFGSVEDGVRFTRVLLTVRHDYVHRPDPEQLTDGAIGGMVQSLNDPYSYYLPAGEFTRFTQSIEGKFVGVGIILTTDSEFPRIMRVLPGGSAEAADVPVNGYIVAVDGETTKGMPLPKTVEKITGPANTQVTITVRSDNGDRDFTLQRKEFSVPTVTHEMMPEQIGYLRIGQFTEHTPEEVNRALTELKYQGMQRLVLDLRKNPGGSLAAVTAVADHFVSQGELVRIVPRSGKTEVIKVNGSNERVPLVVLIDHDSASASEILAAAIRDHQTGILMGTTTYGKGTVQSVLPVSDATGLRLTIAEYYSPNGSSINGYGVTPDIDLGAEADTPEALQTAIEEVKKIK
ncbi:MAG: S41 family peptidase [Negativicoccus succinicivorans]|nr:S41 family peptidase [Negativicoccus succinicivorans]